MKYPVTKTIIVLCSVGFIAQCVAQWLGFPLTQSAALNVSYPEWWQYLSYMWLHGNLWHLVINVFVLYQFAKDIEERTGWLPLAVGYLWCGSIGLLGAMRWITEGGYIVGSSVAVFALLAMYCIFNFEQRIKWLFIPRPIPVWLFFVFLCGVEVICCCVGYKNAIMHLYGILNGCSFAIGGILGKKLHKKFGG